MLDKHKFVKVWGKPIWLFLITIAGLLFAIMGTGIAWYALSWIALGIPLYAMVKHGRAFFRQ
ncbi:hypothetical protein [Parapedobacter koreensis]|uniref:Uncharacterized protein n=1 Tax=Parapedobacter koreensis TaxID=332977 RepID=A0A1H7IVR3_9SPHI|nr:hypothetical protein [Parapedobacter koreensis]SEK66486.1 hypothetical protein SAMN05421740_102378 [Parapedobacter koreensis]